MTTATGTTPVRPFAWSSLRSWWMVAVLFFLYVFSWLDRLVLSMLVGPIKSDLGLTDFQMSLVLGPAFAITYALFGLPFGWAADRFPRRWVIYLGTIIWSVATCMSGFARSFVSLLLARIGVGVGEASLMPSAYSLLADGFPRDRLMLATSVYQMGGKVGSAMAFGIGGVLIAYAETLRHVDWPLLGPLAPWHLVFVMVGAPGFVLALLVFTFSEPARRGTAANAATGESRGLLRSFLAEYRTLLLLLITGFAAVAICGYTLTAWIPEYIVRAFGWKPIKYGAALSVMNLFAAATLVVNGKIVDTLYGRGMKDAHLRFYVWLMVGMLPVALALFAVTNPWVFLGLYGLFQIITVPFMIYVSALIAMLAPNQIRGQLIAISLFVCTTLGMGLGPTFVGFIVDYVYGDEARLGSAMAIVIVTAFVIALVAMWLALRHLAPAIRTAESRLAASAAAAG
jgi:MFS family permease